LFCNVSTFFIFNSLIGPYIFYGFERKRGWPPLEPLIYT
jgi:hypothetical protein